MNNTISLGNFELVLKNISSKAGKTSQETAETHNCPVLPPILIPLLPFLLDYFLKGAKDAESGTANDCSESKEELAKRIDNELLPKLLVSNGPKDEDNILKDVYSAFPLSKKLVSEIRDKYNPEASEEVQAFVWVPVIIVYTLIAAYAFGSGYKDGKDAKDNKPK